MEKVLSYSHTLLKKYLNDSSVVVDATCGLGQDTLFLAGICKKVYAFDIQEVAINKTKERCKDFGNIEYILDGHENVLDHIKEEIDGVIFNLGYLPGENHTITTKSSSTLKALESVMKILKVGGVIVVVVYPGHGEGRKESESLLEYLKKVDQHTFDIIKYEFINQINDPPYLVAIERIS